MIELSKVIEQAEKTHKLTKDEIVAILSDDSCNELLVQTADKVRQKYIGDDVELRGLLEFSNYCKQDCLYCGLRRSNRKINRYRLSKAEIIDFAEKGYAYGYRTIVMQSGEDGQFSNDDICELLREMKRIGFAITLSIGEKSYDEYKAFKEAGADRYLLRIETTDSNLYRFLNPEKSHENRFECLNNLRELGYEVGSGIMVGLPNQSLESIANDLLYFKRFDMDMLGIGPFIPNPNTPLALEKTAEFKLAIKTMALARILMPDINIPATTAMETLDKRGREKALMCGANVVMPNITEGDYRKLYELYPGKICVDESPIQCSSCIRVKIKALGRKVSEGFGFRKKINSP